MPKVSILIPTHDRHLTIASAVESALGQTYKDIEVLVGDDGSEIWEKTQKALRHIKDKRLKTFRRKTNRGVAYTRNELMERAEGDYIAWLDSDDVCNKWRIELQVKAIEQYQRPYVRTATTTFGVKAGHSWQNPPIVVYKGGVCFAAVMFRRELAIQFDTGYNCCKEDMDWEFRFVHKHGRAIKIPLTLYGIGRKSPDRLTNRFKDDDYKHLAEADGRKYKAVADKLEKAIEDAGKTKRPLEVSWEFIRPYLEMWYHRTQKHQAEDPK